jgi:hypothetical protein
MLPSEVELSPFNSKERISVAAGLEDETVGVEPESMTY